MTTKDAYQLLESAYFLKDNDIVQPATPEDVETRRRIIDFVHEIETARFMLAMSYKDPYLDLVEEKDYNNKFKTEYFKQHYLYSALLWYHNSFDLILQCLWFKFRLYGSQPLRDDNIGKILSKCQTSEVVKRLDNEQIKKQLKDFIERNTEVHDLANRLKHRQYIENYNYMLYAEVFNVETEGYNSEVTRYRKRLKDIQSMLMDYHREIIQLAEDLLIPIHNSIINLFAAN
jgi:hypothetical protein